MVLVLPLLFLFGILQNRRIKFHILFSREGICLQLFVYLLFHRFTVPFERYYRYTELSKLPFLRKRRSRKAPFQKRILIDGISLKRLFLRASLGIREDAFMTVLLTAFLRIFFEDLCCCLALPNFGYSVRPFFGQDVFWLDLEGIVDVRPVKSILTAIILKKRGFEGGA